MNYYFKKLSLIFGLAACISVSSTAFADDSVMLVLDASGSMWGKVDNKAKIEIARDALKNMLGTWPDNREVGLVAYGHRDKGDCNDIETLIKSGPLDKDKINQAAAKLTPKGMTPLSAAVKHAAEELKFTEKKATVILISDGVETCKLDPCSVGSELEKLGVDFTAHVIGFDVAKVEDQKGLKCLAENTGGIFISASNTNELNTALAKAIKVETPVPTPTTAPTKTAEPTATPQPKGKIEAAETAAKGTSFKAQAVGAKELNGFINLYAVGKDNILNYAGVMPLDEGEGYKESKIQLPFKTGDYILKWESLDNQVIAEKPLKIVEADVKIEAPAQITIGTEFTIKLTGPDGLEGYIYLYKPGKTSHITYSGIRPKDDEAGYQDSKMRALGTPGKFVLKFLTNKEEVMAEQEIEFVDAEIGITGPEEAPAATRVTFEVSAPDGLTGYLYLYKPGKKEHLTYGSVREKNTGGYEPIDIDLPATPGDYEIKWLTNNDEVLATKKIKSVKADISITAPEKVTANTDFEVTLNAPAGIKGYVYMYAKGKKDYAAYGSIFEGKIKDYDPINIKSPQEPGAYELKLETNEREVLATSEITVE